MRPDILAPTNLNFRCDEARLPYSATGALIVVATIAAAIKNRIKVCGVNIPKIAGATVGGAIWACAAPGRIMAASKAARRVFFMENLYLSEVFQAAKSANVSKRLDAGFFSGKRNFRIGDMSRGQQMIPAGQEARMP